MSDNKTLTLEQRRLLLATPAGWLACGFGSGLAPKAQGTFGSLAAVLPWLLLRTLPLQLSQFVASYEKMYPPGLNVKDRLNEGIKLAGTVLTIVPVLVVYIILQRWFVEGVDRTGITGE